GRSRLRSGPPLSGAGPCRPSLGKRVGERPMNIDFTGRLVVVTGGAGGIGGAVAQAFRQSGASVLATALDVAEIRRAQADQRLAGVELAPLDVTDDAAVRALAARVGPIDILVNCAGTTARGEPAFEEELFG